MNGIQLIPKEVMCIIPKYNGDPQLLGMFIRKCEYVVDNFKHIHEAQDTYVFHVITSRLTGIAAALISDRADITTWDELKELLTVQFSDPRTEECLAVELECMKMNSHEAYNEFCSRIQLHRNVLFSKVNKLDDETLKANKRAVYNNLALNVFLYNLPEELFRIVTTKSPETLEVALSIVLEEVNLQRQYFLRNQVKSPFRNVPQNDRGYNNLTWKTTTADSRNVSFGSQSNQIPKFGASSSTVGFGFGSSPQSVTKPGPNESSLFSGSPIISCATKPTVVNSPLHTMNVPK